MMRQLVFGGAALAMVLASPAYAGTLQQALYKVKPKGHAASLLELVR